MGDTLQQRAPEMLRGLKDFSMLERFDEMIFFDHEPDEYRKGFEEVPFGEVKRLIFRRTNGQHAHDGRTTLQGQVQRLGIRQSIGKLSRRHATAESPCGSALLPL